MSEEKKEIVRDLRFGGLMHIPPLRVHHQILRELANSFKLGENRLETDYGSFKVRQKTIGAALGINASDLSPQKVNYKDLSEDDKQIFRRFQGKTLKNLTDEMMTIGIDNEQDRLMFKRIFILYIQMAFLLPTTINKISPVHLAPIFKMDTITERNWGAHVLNFIIKGITDYNLKKKKSIDGCLFALMIVYFYLSKNKDKKRAESPPEPWIANWTREQLVERMRAEMEEHMLGVFCLSSWVYFVYPVGCILFIKLVCFVHLFGIESKKRKKIPEDSDSESESTDETQSKKKKVIVEDSSPEQAQSYHGSEIGTEDLDEFLRENNEKSAAQGEKEADLRSRKVTMSHLKRKKLYLIKSYYLDLTVWVYFRLSLVEESASELAEENMMVVREETQSEALAIVPIQVCLPLSQTTIMPEIEETPETENEPTPVLQIEGTTKGNPAPEDTAALMMMARTASYVPKTDPMPSFSIGLTDSSQEEAATQEGASTQDGGRAKTPEIPKLLEQLGDLVQKIASGGMTTKEKSPQIPKESGAESFEKFETPARTNQRTYDMKKKCYLWAIRVKKYANGLTNEFDTVCTLQAQDRYILSKLHLASLAPETHIEAEIVSAMCFILNQQKIKRCKLFIHLGVFSGFVWVYFLYLFCGSQFLQNMALGNHPQGVFLQSKNNKPFMVEDYPMFIPFLDLKKLASHRYIFAPVCHSQHWWLWLADTRKRKFYIVDPYHMKSPSDERTALNTFIYMLGAPLKTRDKDKKIEPPYLNILGQKTSYDCAIYVMKWLEIFQPENIKRQKYEWDNWTQDEVDHFRVEYAFRILFHEINQDKAEAIRGSNAIRLSKPSSLLLSPYCQIDSKDIDTD
ncbi:hypothetical protein Ahy_B06g083727 [Arachis hypogaea]|uniref:Ubiquitin-like protease family profile domain-containing protein n=1 Tax=Arachis hypogaea TaxID=3818 RepID=A0A444YQB2_ARAHY|nr:hypothetical protein Ahy_B06g083727 [Arachis hypogaea]